MLRRTTLAVAMLIWGMASSAMAAQQGEAGQILELTGVKNGLCVVLGCGREASAALVADLAAESSLLVHGLALDDAALARVRRAIEAKGVLGQAAAERVAIDPLPYVRDLANIVVIVDSAALNAAGLKMEEVQRIVAPGGSICTRQDGRWTRTLKQRPREMDEWMHPTHGPDGNQVSTDRVLRFPVGLRWLDGVPMNFNLWAACRGVVVADGRCITLNTAELENIAPVSFLKHQEHEYVLARDAYNGMPLWKVDCETINDGKALNSRNIAAIVTDGKRVYVLKKDQLVALDAATGKTVTTYRTTYPTVRLLLSEKVLVHSGWEAREAKGLWDPWVIKTDAGVVEAFDSDTGKLKWSVPYPAQEMLAADGLVYLLIQSGAPAKEQDVVAVDVQTGKEKWRMPHSKLSSEPDLHMSVAGQKIVLVARTQAKSLAILSAADGKVLWEIKPTQAFWAPIVDGLLWHSGKKYDPLTGEVKGRYSGVGGPGVCTPCNVVGPYVTNTRGCTYYDLSEQDGPNSNKGKSIRWAGARGACIEAVVPANGMFYTAQNNCRCSPGQVPGFVAFGPCGEEPPANEFEQARPVEKGPAFGLMEDAAGSEANQWPMFLGNPQRNGVSPAKLPQDLKPLWTVSIASRPQGPLASVWASRLRPIISAPVVAGGIAFVAATEAGQVAAMDAVSGSMIWRFSAGGRIDSPPTIYRGLCVFGSHDGWVYALRASDGQLAWRARVAPRERRMVAFGQTESVWPVIGSVLVHEGLIYANAGRTSESDGGVAVCAFEPATGRQVWGKQVGPGPQRQNDVLLVSDTKVVLHQVALDPKNGSAGALAADARARLAPSLEGLLDGTWTRIGNRRSGDHRFGRAKAEMLAWTDTMVYGYDYRGRSFYAISRGKLVLGPANDKERERLEGKDYAWRSQLPPNHQAEAMVMCDSGLLVAGRIADKTGTTGAFLWLISIADGKKIAEFPLESPPTYEGLAVASERVWVATETGKVICYCK